MEDCNYKFGNICMIMYKENFYIWFHLDIITQCPTLFGSIFHVSFLRTLNIISSTPLTNIYEWKQSVIFHGNTLFCRCITLSAAMVCLFQLVTKCQQIIHKSRAPYVMQSFHARCTRSHGTSHASKSRLKFDVSARAWSWVETVHKTPVLKTLSNTN